MRSAALVVAWLVACESAKLAPLPEPDGGRGGSDAAGEAGHDSVDGGAAPAASAGDAGEPGSGSSQGGGGNGTAGASDCDPTSFDEPPRARGIALNQIAVFQGVKAPIMELGFELPSRKTNVIAGRAALLRAYVKPSATWQPRVVTARLTLAQPGAAEPQVFAQDRLIMGPSNDAQLATTFNFELAAELVTEDVSYSIELLDAEPCLALDGNDEDARFPVEGVAPVGALPGHTLRIQLVPVEHDTGSAKLLPDTSADQLERLRAQVQRLFPVASVELELREQPLASAATTMLDVLDEVEALRVQESPPANVIYYGLVRLTETKEQYCAPSCMLGASFNGELPSVGTAVGIGYTGEEAARTFVHELGHAYGRPHTPCGVPGDVGYPYSGGRIGSWGYDVASKMLFDPDTYSDFMGYCQPYWVSDHSYERLREFIASVEAMLPTALTTIRRPLEARSAEVVSVPEWAYRDGAGLRFGQSRPADRLPLSY